MNLHVPTERLPVLVVTGLARETKLAAGPGLDAVTSGGNSQRLRHVLAQRTVPGCSAVISFGIAGGLDPSLVAGDVVIATGVIGDGKRWPTHPELAASLAASLSEGGVSATLADFAGVDAPLLDPAAKAAVHHATGAAVADMESHVACEFAARHGLMFAGLRIVCDPAESSMPAMVAKALKPDGGVDHYAVLTDLLRKPRQIGALTRLAGEARTSFLALGRCRDLLGIERGIPKLVELLGDVA